MKHEWRWIAGSILVVCGCAPAAHEAATAGAMIQAQQVADVFNGDSIRGDGIQSCGYFKKFLQFYPYERFGWPISDILIDASRHTAYQYYSNALLFFDYTATNPEVQVADLGRQMAPPDIESSVQPDPGFLTIYERHAETLGQPLSSAYLLPDDDTLLVQWFEKGRIEHRLGAYEPHISDLGYQHQQMTPVAAEQPPVNTISAHCWSVNGVPRSPEERYVLIEPEVWERLTYAATGEAISGSLSTTAFAGMVAEKAPGLLQRSGVRLAGVVVAAAAVVVTVGIAVWRFARPDPQLYLHLNVTHTPAENDVPPWPQLGRSPLVGTHTYPQDGTRAWNDYDIRTPDDIKKENEYGYCDCVARYEERIETSTNSRQQWLDCSKLGSSYVVRGVGCTAIACEKACQSAADYLAFRARTTDLSIPGNAPINASDCQRSTLHLEAYYEHGASQWCVPTPPLYPQGGEIRSSGVHPSSIVQAFSQLPYIP
jgi:hypothetical protein